MPTGWRILDTQNNSDYRPIGRRRPGRPLNRLMDGYRETETGHLLV